MNILKLDCTNFLTDDVMKPELVQQSLCNVFSKLGQLMLSLIPIFLKRVRW